MNRNMPGLARKKTLKRGGVLKGFLQGSRREGGIFGGGGRGKNGREKTLEGQKAKGDKG